MKESVGDIIILELWPLIMTNCRLCKIIIGLAIWKSVKLCNKNIYAEYILFCNRNHSSLSIGLYNNCTLTHWRLCVSMNLTTVHVQTLIVACISFIIINHCKTVKEKMHILFGFILILFINFYSNNIISDYFLVKLPAIWFLTNKLCINK